LVHGIYDGGRYVFRFCTQLSAKKQFAEQQIGIGNMCVDPYDR